MNELFRCERDIMKLSERKEIHNFTQLRSRIILIANQALYLNLNHMLNQSFELKSGQVELSGESLQFLLSMQVAQDEKGTEPDAHERRYNRKPHFFLPTPLP